MVEKIRSACPVCKGHVRGDKQHKYFCKNCNLLFEKRDLEVTKEHLEHYTKKRIVKKVNRDLLRKAYD